MADEVLEQNAEQVSDIAMKNPIRLKKGDAVGIISPSLPVYSVKNLKKGIQALESIGLKPKLSKHAMEVYGNFQAGPIQHRVEDIHSMFLDDEVTAIFCAGGGYSSIQLLEFLDWSLIRNNPKIFVGYSDITTLLLSMNKKADLVTFHGPTVEAGLASDLSADSKGGKFSFKSFQDTLMKGKTGKLPNFTEWKVLKPGRVEGTLVGGNLDILLSLVGTPYEPDWNGKVLFWEETGQNIEALSNFMWRMRAAGIFKKIQGMVIGKITDIDDIEDSLPANHASLDKAPTFEYVLREAVDKYDFPILYGVDFGHDCPSLTLPVGANVVLDCPENRVGKITIQSDYLAER